MTYTMEQLDKDVLRHGFIECDSIARHLYEIGELDQLTNMPNDDMAVDFSPYEFDDFYECDCFFLIDQQDARRLMKHTNLTIFHSDTHGLYFYGNIGGGKLWSDIEVEWN